MLTAPVHVLLWLQTQESVYCSWIEEIFYAVPAAIVIHDQKRGSRCRFTKKKKKKKKTHFTVHIACIKRFSYKMTSPNEYMHCRSLPCPIDSCSSGPFCLTAHTPFARCCFVSCTWPTEVAACSMTMSVAPFSRNVTCDLGGRYIVKVVPIGGGAATLSR